MVGWASSRLLPGVSATHASALPFGEQEFLHLPFFFFLSFILFLFFLVYLGPHPWHMEVPRLGVDQSSSCQPRPRPRPQPQPCWIWAMSATYTTATAMLDP